ncbi:hypothetical protein EQVG_00465 [Emiliania huxleyi virus 207]|nr:hypothetical protein EQVG_00465 [Emiliania huxleyi virus 207]
MLGRKKKTETELYTYLSNKTKAYACTASDAVEVCKDLTCTACGLTDLHLRNEDGYDPRKLVIDCIDRAPNESRTDAHRVGNIQPLCYMCNAMKNNVTNHFFTTQLIPYLKGMSDLDLSNMKYTKVGDTLDGQTAKFINTLITHDNSYTGKKWEWLDEQYNKQNSFDAIFNKFPIIFSSQHRFICSASVDQVVSNRPEHGFQLLPLFMNFAKSTMSSERLVEEFVIRGFFSPNHTSRVLLPPNYYDTSYIVKNMGVSGARRARLAKKRTYVMSEEQKQAISNAKKGKPNLKARKVLHLVATPVGDPTTEHHFSTYFEAIDSLRLPKGVGTNIQAVTKPNTSNKTAYGYIWKEL